MVQTSSHVLGCMLVVALLTVVLVFGGITTATPTSTATGPAPTGTAQPQQPPTGSTPTTSTNATSTSTSNNGGPLDWLADKGNDIVSGITNTASNTIDGFQQTADNAYRSSMDALLGPLVTVMVEVPTFGLGLFDDSPGLHQPTRWPFTQLFPLYLAIQALTGSFLVITLAAGFAKLGYPFQNTYRTTQLVLKALKAMLIAVGAHLLLIALLHTTVNEIALAIAPTTKEMASDLGKVVMTTGAAGIIGAGMGKEVLIQLAKMWTLIWAALMLFPIISGPFFAAWQFSPKSTLGHLSGTLIWLYFGLLLSKIIVAVDLRAAWMLTWKFAPLGILNGLLTIAFFWLAFFIPPGVLIAILFGRSRALNTLSAAAAGAASGNYVSAKLSEKHQAVKESVATRAKEAGNRAKGRAAQRTRTTAETARRRVGTAAGAATGNRVGHRRRPREPSGTSYADGSSFTGWRTRDTSDSTASESEPTEGGDEDADTATAETTTTATGSTRTTKTTAQHIREVKHRTRQRGHGTPEDRRRYYDLRDQQKYGDQVENQQASAAQNSAKRRYASANGRSRPAGRSSQPTGTTSTRSAPSDDAQSTQQTGDKS